MFKKVIVISFVSLLLCPHFLSAYSETSDLMELSLNELMNVSVVTAGRSAQKISEAPAAMSVVTAEDIKQSGATQIDEALQMVAGVHLGHTNSNFSLAGGIRGFHKLPANKIKLLIDGIPWAYEMYSIPIFFQIPISLEEIDRIEVLRGPGSSLYGANAMFGVINVITKKPEDTRGTVCAITAGEDDLLLGTLMHGGSAGEKLDFRVTAAWDQKDNRDYIAWANDPEQRYWKISSTFDYEVNNNSSLSLFAGYINPTEQDVIVESAGPVDQSDADTFRTVLSYTAKNPKLKINVYDKESDSGKGYSLGQKYLNFKMGSRGVELQHEWRPVNGDTLVWGANFEQLYADGPSIDGNHTHNMPGIFLDNSYHFTDSVSLNTGIRFDHHPNTDSTVSHRVSLLYTLLENHHFRLTWGTSYRNPDFIETYYSRVSPIAKDTFIHVFGREENDPEKATTYEAGYIGKVSERCIFNANLYYTKLDDYIYFIPFGDPYFDPEVGGVVIPYPFINIGDAEQYGAELEVQYQFTEWLSGLVNYTYIDQKAIDDPVEQLLKMTPRNMANGQLRAKFKNGLSVNASVHYKDVTRWREYTWFSPAGNTNAGGIAESHVYANLRLGYDFMLAGKTAEAGISAFNLFNTGFDEYPLDTSDVARRVSGTFLIRF